MIEVAGGTIQIDRQAVVNDTSSVVMGLSYKSLVSDYYETLPQPETAPVRRGFVARKSTGSSSEARIGDGFGGIGLLLTPRDQEPVLTPSWPDSSLVRRLEPGWRREPDRIENPDATVSTAEALRWERSMAGQAEEYLSLSTSVLAPDLIVGTTFAYRCSPEEDWAWKVELRQWEDHVRAVQRASPVLGKGLRAITKHLVEPLRLIPKGVLSDDERIYGVLWTAGEHRMLLHLYANATFSWLHRQAGRESVGEEGLPFAEIGGGPFAELASIAEPDFPQR